LSGCSLPALARYLVKCRYRPAHDYPYRIDLVKLRPNR
jgi:hypothetical protein